MKREHRRQRAEGLFLRDQRIRTHIRQHGRLEEGATERMALAAGDDPGAARYRIRDVALDLLDGLLVDQRPLRHAGLGAVADLHRRHFPGQLLDELVVDAVLRVEPVGADTGLAHVAIFRDHRAIDGGIDIGIVEHHERRIAAELEPEPLHADRGLLVENLADRGGAGEADEAHRRMFAQHRADRGGIAGDDVEHALRHAGALGEFGERQRRERRLVGRLQHHGAARGQRRRHLRVIIELGKFHGVIAPQTPIGCLMASRRASARWVGIVSP